MKTKIISLFTCMLMISLLVISNVIAQQPKYTMPVYPKPNSSYQIPFGKKLLPPPSLNFQVKGNDHTPYTKKYGGSVYLRGMNNAYRPSLPLPGNNKPLQSMTAQKNAPSGFHLTKDINTHTQPGSSYPYNSTYTSPESPSFAVINNVSYFNANDG